MERIRNLIIRGPLLPLLLTEVTVLDLIQLPEALSFIRFAFGDAGANFAVQYLIAHGARPEIDFGFQYGLLSLLAGRIWFALMGSTPYAYVAANFLVNLSIAWALARVARLLNLGAAGRLFMVASVGYAVYASYPNFAHMLEASLLVWAIAEQTRGARNNALALAALAALAKPTMAYLYGAILIAFDILESRANGYPRRHAWLILVQRGAIVWIVAASFLAAVYGPTALMHTVLPLSGERMYRAMHFGFFFGEGRYLVYSPGTRISYYLETGSAFWILAGIYLVWCGALSIRSLLRSRGQPFSRAAEIVATCAIMHVAFVMLFFAGPWSDFYYSYLLVLGGAAAAGRSALARAGVLVLCVFAILGYTTTIRWSLHDWVTETRAADTAWLWVPPDLDAEWSQVLELTRGRRAVVLSPIGDADLMFPQFEPPVLQILVPGTATRYVGRKVEQVSKASMLVVSELPELGWRNGVPPFKELRDALEQFQPVYSGHYFRVVEPRPILN